MLWGRKKAYSTGEIALRKKKAMKEKRDVLMKIKESLARKEREREREREREQENKERRDILRKKRQNQLKKDA